MASIVSSAPVALVAALHGYFMVLESVLWTRPRTRKTFGMTAAQSETTKTLAMNQGVYNGFLAAGLIWGLTHHNEDFAAQIKLFFLGCVTIAGTVGGATAAPRIFFVQSVPAMVAAGLVYAGF